MLAHGLEGRGIRRRCVVAAELVLVILVLFFGTRF